MGLDIVEFVMSVEEAFGLRIPDDVATSLTTPRRVIDYVYGQLPQSRESLCISQRSFYAIRCALREHLQTSHAHLRPSTLLLSVLPEHNAREVWAKVGKTLGASKWTRVRGKSWFARTFLQSHPQTLGEAARVLATLSPKTLKQPGEGWSSYEVTKVVDGLMRDHFGICEYSLDDRFVQDLGLD